MQSFTSCVSASLILSRSPFADYICSTLCWNSNISSSIVIFHISLELYFTRHGIHSVRPASSPRCDQYPAHAVEAGGGHREAAAAAQHELCHVEGLLQDTLYAISVSRLNADSDHLLTLTHLPLRGRRVEYQIRKELAARGSS